MFKKTHLAIAVAAAMVLPAMAHAEIWASMELKNETAAFIKEGQRTSYAKNDLDSDSGSSRDIYKFETSAKIFFNGDIGEESSWHGELNVIVDTQADGDDYRAHELYSQYDWFRELYMDTSFGGFDWRLGKQQVVWGTADGIKLLDIINPTDFRELNQNAMEESRIPVWMVNGERNIGDASNVQLILSQHEQNRIPGLTIGRGESQPFTMLGVDTITGEVNGFYNVAPALSDVAGSFNNGAFAGMFTGGINFGGLTNFAGMTVDGFASNPNVMAWQCSAPGVCPDDPSSFGPGDVVLNNIAQNGLAEGDPNGNNNITNLMDIFGEQPSDVKWNPNKPKSAFEYMSNASFATFNTFTQWTGDVGMSPMTGIETQWKRDYDNDPNFGGRFRHSLDNGLNFSLNYFYHYSANPAISLSWHDKARGNEELDVVLAPTTQGGVMGVPDTSQNLTRNQALDNWKMGNATTVLLKNKDGQFYGAFDPVTNLPNGGNPNPASLRFTEETNRVHSLGASFDYAVDQLDVPLVLRGEFLYDKDEQQPVVDKFLLSIGDLANALKMEDADYFKYVLGADVTVFTNMLASFQFIQFRNLDYEDKGCKVTSQGGNTVDCSRYTADFATLHMSNGMNQAEENKEFYSLFLSKPFGESQLGRWNNITIYEEGGGYWNRLDAEYSLTDQVVLLGEVNMYWGDENTTFGQFENSSNVQVGVKVILE